MKSVLRLLVIGLVLLGMMGAARAASAQLKDDAAAGRKLYVTKCSKCHKLYDPRKYSDAEWEKWMGKMSKKAKLTSEQERLLSKYVEEDLRLKKPQGKSDTLERVPQERVRHAPARLREGSN